MSDCDYIERALKILEKDLAQIKRTIEHYGSEDAKQFAALQSLDGLRYTATRAIRAHECPVEEPYPVSTICNCARCQSW